MALELTKGSSLDLNKEANKVLKHLRLGAGWDMADGKTIDLDLWLVPKGAKPLYFSNKSIPGASLDHDDRTGGSSKDGADENIQIDVEKLEKDEYAIVVNIYDARGKGQFFKDVKRAFVEVEDVDGKAKILNYAITENGGDNFTLVAGKLVKKNGGLEFHAMQEFSTKEPEAFVNDLGGVV